MRLLTNLFSDTKAAVAPTVAMSLFGLLAAGGLAFDYARIAGLDTELQQAADQAALAAATQLDRAEGAQERAQNAIRDGDAENLLASNLTRFASFDAQNGPEVTIDDITFCEAFDDSVADNDDACTAASGEDQDELDSNSRFVVVTTSLRTAPFALTPVVGLLQGDQISATAVAGVEASICNVAPLFVCTEDSSFPSDEDIGRGLLLKTGSGNSWAPGNYGLFDFGSGNTGVINALLGFGLNGCQQTGEVNTQPGNKNVTDAINTRLDVYAGNPETRDPDTVCDVTTGEGCPALSARKDMVVRLEVTANNTTSSTPPAAAACPTDPKGAGAVLALPSTPVRGLPRDTCHLNNSCAEGNFGDKNWNRADYFAQNHTAADIASALAFVGKTDAATLTRYDVYRWELASAATRLGPKRFVTTTSTLRNNGRWNHSVVSQCTYSAPVYGRTTYPAQKDRRVLPIVAANCAALNGVGNPDEDFTFIRAFDVFITEPSAQRTYPGPSDDKEIYGEVIGPAETFSGGGGFQYYSRSKPYLVR